MNFKINWTKPKTITALTTVALLSTVYFTSNTLAKKDREETYNLTQAEFTFPESQVEYIRFDHNDGSYEEHWRDTENKQERHDRYSKDGELINRLIVVDSGKKVISIGNDGGKLEAYTWELPTKDANENNELLQKSLIKETKDQMNDKKWTISKSSKLAKDESVDEIESTHDGMKEVVRLDADTGVPLQREIFEVKGNKEEKVVTETYEFIDGSSDLFTSDIKAKEVPEDDIVVTKED